MILLEKCLVLLVNYKVFILEVFANQFQIFVVVFARLLATFSIAPFFASESFSFVSKVVLSLFISILIVPVIQIPNEFNTTITSKYFGIILEQVFIGLVIGMGLQMIFAAFQLAGEFFSTQMGFNIGEVMDPLSQTSTPLIANLKNLIGLYVFFISGCHLWVIQSIAYSFNILPYFKYNILTVAASTQSFMDFLMLMCSGMFIVALKIALPVMGTLLLVAFSLGLVSKASPQMNLLTLGFPVQILTAFAVLTIIAPNIIEVMLEQFDLYFKHLDTFLHKWAKFNAHQ